MQIHWVRMCSLFAQKPLGCGVVSLCCVDNVITSQNVFFSVLFCVKRSVKGAATKLDISREIFLPAIGIIIRQGR